MDIVGISISANVADRLKMYGRMTETVDSLLMRMMDCLDDSYKFWNDDGQDPHQDNKTNDV